MLVNVKELPEEVLELPASMPTALSCVRLIDPVDCRRRFAAEIVDPAVWVMPLPSAASVSAPTLAGLMLMGPSMLTWLAVEVSPRRSTPLGTIKPSISASESSRPAPLFVPSRIVVNERGATDRTLPAPFMVTEPVTFIEFARSARLPALASVTGLVTSMVPALTVSVPGVVMRFNIA